MSVPTRVLAHADLYSSGCSVRPSTSPSRSSSASSASSSSLTFSKEEDFALPKRTSALAAQLRLSQSRRERDASLSRSSTSSLYAPHWAARRADDDEEADREREAAAARCVTGDAAEAAGALAHLPYDCRVFIDKSVCGCIATSRPAAASAAACRRHKLSLSSSTSPSASSSSPSAPSSASTSSPCSSFSLSESALPAVTCHINAPCSLSRLCCEIIAACTSRAVDAHCLSLSRHFSLLAADSSGRLDDDCPPLEPQQAVHHFNIHSFLFLLCPAAAPSSQSQSQSASPAASPASPSSPAARLDWSQWRLPHDELWLGPRVSSLSRTERFLSACSCGDVERVRQMLDEAASTVGSLDAEGRTGLHAAATGGHVNVLHLLCKRDAAVDAQDGQGRTAMLAAAEAGSLDCVEALLLWGGNMWLPDARGRDVVAVARDSDAAGMREMIGEFITDSDAIDDAQILSVNAQMQQLD